MGVTLARACLFEPACCAYRRAAIDFKISVTLKIPIARKTKMSREDQNDTRSYKVVINHEEQYSIWFADRDNPSGWRDAGKAGTKSECLDYIQEVWTDMRPLSLRRKMETASA
jgi:MbtH protein